MTTKPRRAAETAVSKKIETYQELQRLLKLTKGHLEKYSLEAGRSAIEVAAVSV